jgi:D-alanyl-D-alanine carboxypeptidase/D-alanyl-D-alanine-endopeptidase (penicillin-binding protein 4)
MLFIIIISVCLLLYPISAQRNQEQLQTLAQKCNNHPNLQYGQWSACALNTTSNRIILAINSKKSLIPASNIKIITSAAALDLLDENECWHTYLEYSGTINKNGELNGNIYLRGEGDPTLGSSQMNGALNLDSLYQLWVSQIKKLQIQTINGEIIGDDSYLDFMPIAGDWSWMDMGNYYAPPTSGLCIHENMYTLFFQSPQELHIIAQVLRTEPVIEGLSFHNTMRTGRVKTGSKAFIYGAPGQWKRILAGYIPAGKGEYAIEGSLPDPALFAARYLKLKLEQANIKVNGKAAVIRDTCRQSENRTTISIVKSPPLKNMIYRLNKYSVNLYAEQILKVLGEKMKGRGSREKGIELIMEWLTSKNISTKGIFIRDGSGLSRSNSCTTRFFVELLDAMSRTNNFKTFYDSLPVAGDSNDQGNLKKMGKGTRAAANVHAKTGTMERVRCISGYVHSRSKELICFSIMANNFIGKSKIIDQLHESIIVSLAEMP